MGATLIAARNSDIASDFSETKRSFGAKTAGLAPKGAGAKTRAYWGEYTLSKIEKKHRRSPKKKVHIPRTFCNWRTRTLRFRIKTSVAAINLANLAGVGRIRMGPGLSGEPAFSISHPRISSPEAGPLSLWVRNFLSSKPRFTSCRNWRA